ncbi:MAG TPA: YdcF family protein [Candidatus Limnocylindrales bacterium]|nr:YdcF family protein [Candidatus Limnocylindrales bacterium]
MRRELIRIGAWLIAGSVLVGLYTVYRISTQGDRDERRPADAIVVLGAAQFNGVPSDVFAARLDHAVELYQAGLAPYLIVTGGKQPGDRTTEAATARAYAIAHGVRADRILTEDKGRNTLDSIEAVGAIFRAHHFGSGLFVSDRTHMLRVLRMASDQGLVAWGSPTTTSPTDTDQALRQRAVAHELAGLIAYYFGGGKLVDESVINDAP